MITYNAIIKFIDGEELVVHKVHDIVHDKPSNTYYIKKNGYIQFFNGNQIKYIGREFDLREGNIDEH